MHFNLTNRTRFARLAATGVTALPWFQLHSEQRGSGDAGVEPLSRLFPRLLNVT